MNEPQAFLNGQWIPASAATVSIGDAGFVLGTTVAEQLRTFNGTIFRLEDHLARLDLSLQTVGTAPAMTIDQFSQVARELVARNHRLLDPRDDLGLSIFVTPGDYPAYSSDRSMEPNVCLHTYPLPFRLWAKKYHTGQALVTTDVEQVSPRSWPPGLKCRSRMHYYLADRQAAVAEPDARALLLDREGFVTEASTANILIFDSLVGLISPPSDKIIRGISVAVITELAAEFGVSAIQRDFTPKDVAAADEVLLGSTPLCLLPVTRFNGRPVGRGKPGELFHRLLSGWNDLVAVNIAAQAEEFADRR